MRDVGGIAWNQSVWGREIACRRGETIPDLGESYLIFASSGTSGILHTARLGSKLLP